MKSYLKYLVLPVMVLTMAFFVGCDDEETTPSSDVGDVTPDTTPDMVEDADVSPDTPDMAIETSPIMLTFAVDDSANETYDATDGLAWKGSFAYDADTNILAKDGSWGGPFPMLYDDGPISGGGHEAEDQTADDHIWSIATEVEVIQGTFDDATCPTDLGWTWNADDSECQLQLEFGLIRGSTAGSDGEWIWDCTNYDGECPGSNGALAIPADQSEDMDAGTYTIPAFGDIDFRLELDIADLAAGFTDFDPDSDTLTVKGSAWGWSEVALDDAGTDGDVAATDGVYSFVYSLNLGKHDGLLHEGDVVQWVYVIGGVEYKGESGALEDGVTAASDYAATAEDGCVDGIGTDTGCLLETIILYGTDNNTAIILGEPDPTE